MGDQVSKSSDSTIKLQYANTPDMDSDFKNEEEYEETGHGETTDLTTPGQLTVLNEKQSPEQYSYDQMYNSKKDKSNTIKIQRMYDYNNNVV